ncbi:MAG: hypothetical protein R3242_11530 [Akkermansiaceae bacterium]|nr:hypothetical protein [Akkermansiaceae bacterium]
MHRFQDDHESRRPAWFWWGLVNLLALCFAVLSWILATEIFGRPDVPSNYQILRKLDRAPEFESYHPREAPDGRLFDGPELYSWFFTLGDKGYQSLNTLYRRNYMRNFDDAQAVTYVEGNFKVLATRAFGKGDFLPEGFVVRAQALVRPDDFSALAPYPVVIELMVPTAQSGAIELFPEGSRFSLARAPHLPVIMHVGRYQEMDEPTVQVTLMPIGYGSLDTPSGKTIELEVPQWVNPQGRLRFFQAGAGREADGA